MVLYTDNREYARALLPAGSMGRLSVCDALPEPERQVVEALLEAAGAIHSAPLHEPGWRHILATGFACASQYDRLIDLARRARIPDRVACVARTGSGFHGYKGRAWNAAPGNIHLAVHLAPNRRIERFQAAFTALAAVALAEAIDDVPGHERARIKWVNDVLIGEAKVGGVLAYTQTIAEVVTSVVIGIGLNVAVTPEVERSDHVPAAASLHDVAPDPAAVSTAQVLQFLLRRLALLYERLLGKGVGPILDAYRSRSAIIGREVRICEEGRGAASGGVFAEGRVTAIGDGLELYLSGRTEPITRGRVILAAAPTVGA
jgi:BirA family transcriptional regulator, biotin operon repressor / biotin---[acetyl-CoA-carboxylase] ligase